MKFVIFIIENLLRKLKIFTLLYLLASWIKFKEYSGVTLGTNQTMIFYNEIKTKMQNYRKIQFFKF